ncbi:SEL1-like repeat protein [Sneathiella litorea]|uniref:Sel1 repeat family protein n=1 Tax=Sneathiella litorea TaxID=2606216 RepID=A0A6L8WBL1_9PROT|nr:SEL1-like repeat protein [Sneathiella litorea]MZR32445.1 hypothetical protein [Sneathiella litorea]
MKTKRFSLAIALVFFSTQFVQASYETGQEALNNNDASAAIEEWQPIAKRGDAKAQFALGQIFEKGADGVETDIVEAYSWFKLAAAQDYQDANEVIERLRASMSTEDLREAQTRSLMALGVWFRDYTGQDEAAFQETKAATVAQKQSPLETEDSLAEQRAAAQREMIAQRKADAEAKAKALEESRQAAILAAQQAAEEAKRQAEIRNKKIEEQRLAIAQKDAQQSQTSLDAARARLADLMAKQQGAASVSGGSAAAASSLQEPVTPAQVDSTPENTSSNAMAIPGQTEPVAVTPTQKSLAEVQNAGSPADGKQPALLKSEAMPEPKPSSEIQTAALAPSTESAKSSAETNLAEPALTNSKSEALASLKSLDGLNADAVEEIFEQAKIADLDNAAAQTEIEQSLVRIEALKWSLISGAKGDNAAPKLNKVLMSKMSSVQIAEANRLARQWLIDRQKEL